MLSMFRHPNLVVLMGFARNGPKRFLVCASRADIACLEPPRSSSRAIFGGKGLRFMLERGV